MPIWSRRWPSPRRVCEVCDPGWLAPRERCSLRWCPTNQTKCLSSTSSFDWLHASLPVDLNCLIYQCFLLRSAPLLPAYRSAATVPDDAGNEEDVPPETIADVLPRADDVLGKVQVEENAPDNIDLWIATMRECFVGVEYLYNEVSKYWHCTCCMKSYRILMIYLFDLCATHVLFRRRSALGCYLKPRLFFP